MSNRVKKGLRIGIGSIVAEFAQRSPGRPAPRRFSSLASGLELE
jgi:hypothetical protein